VVMKSSVFWAITPCKFIESQAQQKFWRLRLSLMHLFTLNTYFWNW
jgi:hypothetical protein